MKTNLASDHKLSNAPPNENLSARQTDAEKSLGKVYLVGAGPGDPDLLTVKALRLLRSASLVLHDDLVALEILELIPAGVPIRNVGKRCGRKSLTQEEIHARMIDAARNGHIVVRLKGGDPMIYGRAGEELEALHAAGVEVEVVPGVTSALAAAAAAQIPLTDRRYASSVTFLSGHRCNSKPSAVNVSADGANNPVRRDATPGLAATILRTSGLSRAFTGNCTVPVPGYSNAGAILADSPTHSTIVLYMPGGRAAEIAQQLQAAGMDPSTPCLVVSAASTPRQRILHLAIQDLFAEPPCPAPAILIIGEVAAQPHPSGAAQSPNFIPGGSHADHAGLFVAAK